MKIDAIIDSLALEDNLTKPLLSALVFAKRIGNNDLANWVSKELKGYEKDESLPNYRMVKATVSGVMHHEGMLTDNISLPLSCFSEKIQKILMRKRFPESITTLEKMSKDATARYLRKDFSADLLIAMSEDALKNGCDFDLLSCNQLVLISELESISTTVRTMLLELLLKIESDFPKVDPGQIDAKVKSELNSVVQPFVNNIYNISNNGNGNIINTGEGNSGLL